MLDALDDTHASSPSVMLISSIRIQPPSALHGFFPGFTPIARLAPRNCFCAAYVRLTMRVCPVLILEAAA